MIFSCWRCRSKVKPHNYAIEQRQFDDKKPCAFSPDPDGSKNQSVASYPWTPEGGRNAAPLMSPGELVEQRNEVGKPVNIRSLNEGRYRGFLKSGRSVCVYKPPSSVSLEQIEVLSRIQHENVVRLVGYIDQFPYLHALVYEHSTRGSLHDILHGCMDDKRSQRARPILNWDQRVKIALAAVKGLQYLHENARTVHGHVNSSNIILFDDGTAKIANFELPNIGESSRASPYISPPIRITSPLPLGRFVYNDPVSSVRGERTPKSAVYSFGVVLLELLTGRPPIDPESPSSEQSIVRWAEKRLVEDVKGMVDPLLWDNYSLEGAKEISHSLISYFAFPF